MAVVVGKLLAVLEAQTAQFEARMAAASQQINRFGGTTTSARRGVALLRGGLEQLVFRAAGASGPVGKLASGLLVLGAGGGVAIAAAAAIGTVALAIRGLTADTRDSKKAQDELIQSLAKMGAHGQQLSARLRLAELTKARDDPSILQRAKTGALAFLGPAFGGASLAEQRERINREIARLETEIARAGEELEAPGAAARREAAFGLARARSRFDTTGRGGLIATMTDPGIAEQLDILELEYRKIPPAIAREIAARRRAATELELTTAATTAAQGLGHEASLRRRMIGAPALEITEALRRNELLQSGVSGPEAIRVAQMERDAAASMQTTDLLRTMGPQVALQALSGLQQGGVGGFGGALFPGVAGLAAALPGVGPFAGAGIMAVGQLLGGIFGKMETSAERRHREHMEKLEKLANEVGLERVTVVFTGPDGHQIRKNLAELENSDAVPRVSAPVGAAG